MNARVKKQEINSNLSATGSRHAPRNVFAFNSRARKPSTRSVIQANTKKNNAMPQHALTIAIITIGINAMRVIVKSVGIVMRTSALGKRLKIRKENREKLIFFTKISPL